jgi:hypothetical protein
LRCKGKKKTDGHWLENQATKMSVRYLRKGKIVAVALSCISDSDINERTTNNDTNVLLPIDSTNPICDSENAGVKEINKPRFVVHSFAGPGILFYYFYFLFLALPLFPFLFVSLSLGNFFSFFILSSLYKIVMHIFAAFQRKCQGRIAHAHFLRNFPFQSR